MNAMKNDGHLHITLPHHADEEIIDRVLDR